jgi:HAD superfamily hydrolase (TIGR01549 family)
MTKAILFDLDNTLILFDEVKFFKAYIKKVAPIMSDIVSPHTLWRLVLNATKAVLHNNGKLTNQEVFFHTFTQGLEDKTEEIWNRFQQFYENEFDHLKALITVNKGVAEIFSILSQKKIKIVIASNPFWPCSAMEKRMSWAGLNKEQVHLITHLENMHFCKPRLEYYQEICNKIKTNPEDCLMVGDDPVNDMIAGKTGMKTFLITDSRRFSNTLRIISKKIRFGRGKERVKPDYSGSLVQVQKILPSFNL